MNGLDLFSGIGGLSIALSDWVRPIAYCEIDPYCQSVLLSRMFKGELPRSPIWDDITTFPASDFTSSVDIIYGGFPCQDISVAGRGKGLEGERSGLFFEIVRLAKEIKPKFLFLENVPRITSLGGYEVIRSLTEMGYDCRWCVISAASIGALHRRERWFLLAHAKHNGSYVSQERKSSEASIHSCSQGTNEASKSQGMDSSTVLATESIPDSHSSGGWENLRSAYDYEGEDGSNNMFKPFSSSSDVPYSRCECSRLKDKPEWARDQSTGLYRIWETEPNVGRVADGIPHRAHRIRGLGNAVVPQQAKEAFKILMGFK